MKLLSEEFDDLLDYEVIITGHTDSRGTYTYNDTLSKMRADAVYKVLMSAGADAERTQITFSGERKPIAKNNTEDHMQSNRRVEVSYTYQAFTDIAELDKYLASFGENTFLIKPEKSHKLQGRMGVEVEIPEGAFLSRDGERIGEEVTFTLTEAVDFEAFLGNGLSTASKGRLLESGGMVRIEARSNSGEELVLDSNRPILIYLPTDEVLGGMEVFVSEDGSDWKETGRMVNETADIELPERPERKHPPMRFDNYLADESGKPHPPKKPSEPRPPAEPRMASYVPNISFWNFFMAGRIRIRARQRYQDAMTRYHEKVFKYKRKLAKYYNDLDGYQFALDMYWKKYDNWKAEVKKKADDYYDFQVEIYESYYGKLEEAYKDDLANWRKSKDKALAAYVEKSKFSNPAMTDKYVMRTLSLGWINCDRFPNLQEGNNRILALWDNDESPERVQLIFPEIRSMLELHSDGESYKSEQYIPRNIRCIAFAYKVIDGKTYVYREEVGPSVSNLEMNFIPKRLSEFRMILEELRTAS